MSPSAPEQPVLRPASAADATLVHAWANDPQTRAASFASAPIPLADHHGWFARQLAAAEHHLLIAEDSARATPLAFVRLDARERGPKACTISINLAPQARGRGLGTATLEAAASYARELGLTEIFALIRPHNRGSKRAFEKAGYTPFGRREVSGHEALVFVRRLDPLH